MVCSSSTTASSSRPATFPSLRPRSASYCRTVSGVARLPAQLQVTLYRTASPQDGSLTLIFADNPLALRSWITTDAQRHETRVTLYNAQLGGTFDQKLFEFIDPRFFQNSGGGSGAG